MGGFKISRKVFTAENPRVNELYVRTIVEHSKQIASCTPEAGDGRWLTAVFEYREKKKEEAVERARIVFCAGRIFAFLFFRRKLRVSHGQRTGTRRETRRVRVDEGWVDGKILISAGERKT